MTRSLNVAPKTTEQHLIARSDKSVAYVTNNKRLCSTFCTIEATGREEASRGLSATAGLLVDFTLNTHRTDSAAYLGEGRRCDRPPPWRDHELLR